MPSSLVSRIRITRLRGGRIHPKQELYAPDRFGNAGSSENAVRVACGSCALSDGRLTAVCDRRIYRLFGLTECQLPQMLPRPLDRSVGNQTRNRIAIVGAQPWNRPFSSISDSP